MSNLTGIDRVVWQPTFNGVHVAVVLDRSFAQEMLDLRVSAEERYHAQNAGKLTLEMHKCRVGEPYAFYEDTFFVKQFSIGDNGKWLNMEDALRLPKLGDHHVVYHDHNIDYASDTIALLSLFNRWVRMADTVQRIKKEKKN